MADRDLPHPVFLAVLVELRGDAAAQAAADEHLDQPGEEVRLGHHRAAAVLVVDLDVVLLEAEPLRVGAVGTPRRS